MISPAPEHINSHFRGHPAVTRSIVEGCKKISTSVNYNPKSLKDLSQNVVVVSGISAVRQMIALKQMGYIKTLIVGPNVTGEPSNYPELAAPEVDKYITHHSVCEYIARVLPNLANRCRPWASGVDTSFWQKNSSGAHKNALIYSKQNKGPTISIDAFKNVLESSAYSVRVIDYGRYTRAEFHEALSWADFMVGFTRDETQGIAFAEAWSCNVPTLIWRNSEPTYLGVAYHGSSAPYLSSDTGKFFENVEDFTELVSQISTGHLKFSPRKWCEENMSDEVSARNLLKIIDE